MSSKKSEGAASSSVVSNKTRSLGSELTNILATHGVTHIFGIPGVHNLGFYDGLNLTGLTHVLARHEQSAGFMADGYARAGGGFGVALTISGPGVTNIATAVAQAWSDSVPILVLSSALEQRFLGMEHGRVHEMSDQVAVLAGITSQAYLAHHPVQAIEALRRTLAAFATERPRPAHLSIPRNLMDVSVPVEEELAPSPRRPVPTRSETLRAARLLSNAERPVIVAGGGALEAGEPLRSLAEALNAAVVTTVAGKGILSDSHPLSLGSTLQRPTVQAFLGKCDVVLIVGSELAEPDLYITADSETDAGEAATQLERLSLDGKIVRIDIDPQMTTRHYSVTVALWGDAHATLKDLLELVSESTTSRPGFLREVSELKQRAREPATHREAVHACVLRSIRDALPPNGIVAGDMTQLAYTGCVLFESIEPRTWLFPNGFGTLGYAVPAAIGAALAKPDSPIVAIAGDCGFLFSVAELATAVEQRLAIPIILWDNSCLAEIRDGMLVRDMEPIAVYPRNPDFVLLAESFGCDAVAPSTPAELVRAISEALTRDRPTLIHLREDVANLWCDS